MAALAVNPRFHFLPPACSRSPKRARDSADVGELDSTELAEVSRPEPAEPSGPDEREIPCTDDAQWDVFIPDDDCDPLPEPGDFWIEDPEGE